MNDKLQKKDYLDIKYNETEKPLTDFPLKLSEYIFRRFNMKPKTKFLEIGCGRCETLNAFNKLGLDVYGVDSSERAKDFASKNTSKLEILDISKDKLPFNDNEFEVIFCKSVIEHIPDPGFLITEIFRILKSDGVFVVLTPDWNSQMQTFYEDPTHVHPYQLKGLEDLFKINGFKNIKTEWFFYHELIWRSSFWRFISNILQHMFSTKTARSLTKITGNKFFRWGVERQLLGYGYK